MPLNYSDKDHVLAAFERRLTSRVPVRVWYRLGDFDESSGLSRKELRTSGEKFAQYLIWNHKELPSDILTIPVGDAVMIAEGAGSELKISMQEIIERARKGLPLLEDKSLFRSFNLSDLMAGKRLPYYCQASGIVAGEAAGTAIEASSYAPWTMAGIIRGNENMIYDTADDPEFVHGLLRFTTNLLKQAALEIGKTGADMFTFSDPAAGCSVISPPMFRNWAMPYLVEVVEFVKKNSKLKIGLHVCGKVDKIMEDLIATGVDAISIDSPSSLEKMVEINRGRVVIIGNVATELFLDGSTEQIEEAVRQCVDTAAPGGGYILSSGCDVPGTKQNILHFLQYGRDYGRYKKP